MFRELGPPRIGYLACMEVVSACPLPIASLLWRTPGRGTVLTIVCKATYALLPVESSLATQQDALHQVDRHLSLIHI